MHFELEDFVSDKREVINIIKNYYNAKKGIIENDADGFEDLEKIDQEDDHAIILWLHYINADNIESKRMIRLFKARQKNETVRSFPTLERRSNFLAILSTF